MRLFTLRIVVALTLCGCGEQSHREPTDQELKVFINKLEADARTKANSAVTSARRAETDRASAAESRRENSTQERRGQAAQ